MTSCDSCKKPDPTPPPTTTDTQAPTVPSVIVATATTTSISLTWNPSTDNVGVTGYKIYRSGVQVGTSPVTNFTESGLLSSTSYSYTVSAYDAAGNNSNQSLTTAITTLAVAPTFTAVFTATDASLTALDKAIVGGGVVKALVLNVSVAGTAKLESIGSMTNGNPAIAYYWITSKDSSDINQATSTLNPVLAKTVITASQTINLSVGVNVICFKAAAFSGSITNGTQIGLKITGANSNTISNASYTANSGVANTTTIVRINLLLSNNVVVSSGQNTGWAFTDFKLAPYNNEAGSVYDGSMYPSLLSISFDTKDTRYFTTTTGYGNLDFNNASGSQGRSLILAQDDNGANNYMCLNSNASFSSESGIMNFTPSAPQRFLKSFLGNYAYCNTATNVYNSGASNFGPASTCWPIKSIRLASNPEIWIYNPSGTRIQ